MPDDRDRVSSPGRVRRRRSDQRCSDQMFGGSPGTRSGGGSPSWRSVPSSSYERRRSPRLLAPANLQAERERGREVVAREARVDRHVAEARRPARPSRAAGRCLRSGRASRRCTRCPFGRRTRTSSRSAGVEVGHVAERDRADDEIDGVVVERQRRAGRPRETSPPGTFSRARSSISGEESTPITSCPSDARYAVWRPVPHAASSATPTGRPSRISRTTGCSISSSWFPGSS